MALPTLPASVMRSFSRDQSNPSTPLWPAICLPLGMWPGRYGLIPLYEVVLFAHPRQVFMGGPAAGITSPRSVIRGPRPPRPVHREISDPIWRVIESCWHDVASMRMLVGEVVDLLEAELRYIGA